MISIRSDKAFGRPTLNVALVGDVHWNDTPPRTRKDDYFRALLSKFEYVLSENDVVLVTGDLFDRPQVPDAAKNRVIRALKTARKRGVRVLSILGNHDVFNCNLGQVGRTSFGNLLEAGALERLRRIELNGFRVEGIDYGETFRLPERDAEDPWYPQMLMAHAFWMSDLDPQGSMTADHCAQSGASYVVLGHDHAPHNPVNLGSCVVLRPGSLCRNSADRTHLSRQPQYYRMVIAEKGEVLSLELREIPAAKPREVFLAEAFEAPPEKSLQPAALSQIGELLRGFQRISNSEEFSVRKALVGVGAPDSIVSYLQSIHRKHNLRF